MRSTSPRCHSNPSLPGVTFSMTALPTITPVASAPGFQSFSASASSTIHGGNVSVGTTILSARFTGHRPPATGHFPAA